MATKKFSDNDPIVSIAGDEILPITDTAEDMKISMTQISDFCADNADVMNLSGEETATGKKTFSAGAKVSGTSNILELENTSATDYSEIKYNGTAIDFKSGVGNASASISDLRDKFYIYDATNTAVRMTCDNAGDFKFYQDVEVAGSVTITGDISSANLDPLIGEIDPTIVALGTISTGAINLTKNRFHTGNFTGSSSLTMPTVATSDKLVVQSIEFTTDSVSYPTFTGIDNWDYGVTPAWSTTAKNLVTIYTYDGSTFNANYRQIG